MRPELEVVKTCRCCQRSYSAGSWKALEFKGLWRDQVETLEFRNCACGSTLAMPVEGK